MKKVFMLATAVLLVTGISFGNDGGKKKSSKSKTCCKKGGSCCKNKAKTAQL
jgi:hypothetical protein